jgi:hypothetical protein
LVQTENTANGFRQQTEQKRSKRCEGARFFFVSTHGSKQSSKQFAFATEQKRTKHKLLFPFASFRKRTQ